MCGVDRMYVHINTCLDVASVCVYMNELVGRHGSEPFCVANLCANPLTLHGVVRVGQFPESFFVVYSNTYVALTCVRTTASADVNIAGQSI